MATLWGTAVELAGRCRRSEVSGGDLTASTPKIAGGGFDGGAIPSLGSRTSFK